MKETGLSMQQDTTQQTQQTQQTTINPAGNPTVTDTTPRPETPPEASEFERFEDLSSKLVRVPKSELDEQRGLRA